MRVSAGYVSSLQKYVIPSDFAQQDMQGSPTLFPHCRVRQTIILVLFYKKSAPVQKLERLNLYRSLQLER